MSGAMRGCPGTGALVLACLVILPSPSRGAFEGARAGSGPCAFALTEVARADPAFPAFANPAAPFRSAGIRFDALHSARYGMPDLARFRIGLSGARGDLLLSVGADRFGSDHYREETVAVGLGGRLCGRTRIGISARLYHLRIAGLGAAAAAGFDVGLSSEPLPGLRIGAVWRAPNRPRLGASRVRVPSALVVGVEGSLSERAAWTVEGRREDRGDGRIGIGFVFGVTRGVRVGVGMCGETGEYGLGAELDPPYLRVGYAVSIHPALGATHSVVLSFGSGMGGGGPP